MRSPPGRRKAVRIDAGADARQPRRRGRHRRRGRGERLRHLWRLLVGSRHRLGSGVPRPRARQRTGPRSRRGRHGNRRRRSTARAPPARWRSTRGARRRHPRRAVGRGFGAPPPPRPARRHGPIEVGRHRRSIADRGRRPRPTGHRDAVPAASAHARRAGRARCSAGCARSSTSAVPTPTAAETVELAPAEAAARIVDQLRRWGYLVRRRAPDSQATGHHAAR